MIEKELKTIKDWIQKYTYRCIRIDATRNLLLIIIVCLAIRYSNSFKMRRIQNAQFKTFEKQGQGDRKKKKEKKKIS